MLLYITIYYYVLLYIAIYYILLYIIYYYIYITFLQSVVVIDSLSLKNNIKKVCKKVI